MHIPEAPPEMVAPGDYEKIMNVEKKEVAKEKKEGMDLLRILTYLSSVFNNLDKDFYRGAGNNLYHLTLFQDINLMCLSFINESLAHD